MELCPPDTAESTTGARLITGAGAVGAAFVGADAISVSMLVTVIFGLNFTGSNTYRFVFNAVMRIGGGPTTAR